MSTPRVLIAVSHLTGTGHFVRALAIARALSAQGARPLLLAGGRPLPHLDTGGVEIAWLPPLMVTGQDYATLRLPDGTAADAATLAARRAQALAVLARFGPDVLVTETWPFGRGSLRAEFAALSAAAPGRRAVSLRDIPEPTDKPDKRARAEADLAGFDAILVHGDPALGRMTDHWPLSPGAAALLRETGFVTAPLPAPAPPSGEVLVSVGGGATGRHLLALAAEAARDSARPWRLMVGGADAAEEAARLRGLGPALAEPARADYRARLQGAACSVSLCGYNTATDLLQCTTPAVLVPLTEGGEREQRLRAAALEPFGMALLEGDGLKPAHLLAAVETAIARGPRTPSGIDMNGAARSAEILIALAGQPPA
ncbi:glycosyltransferase [Paroceanicella profunda]|uniref:Glycosyltransferase n=1 Tax=Paroceanicella profunda TaxID=2579971 RepID=A0A5B8FGG1_9RHOB|nr:glycosyltransferase [Paroceanicella profunda]QDL90828.1 glycosyltransferase [Paroceanicella profunda]